MKRYNILFLFVLSFFIQSCNTEKVDTFVDRHFVRFAYQDMDASEYWKTNFSFAFLSKDATEYKYKIPVEMIGRTLTEDIYYSIEVDEEKTTLPEDSYSINSKNLFRSCANGQDTLVFTLYRKDALKLAEKTLFIRLLPTDKCGVYQPKLGEYSWDPMLDCSSLELSVSDIMSKPLWWNTTIDLAYLGEYSKMKYDTFVQVTGIIDFGSLDSTYKRHYALMFKQWLSKNPTREDNGELMKVTITG